jgi:hypothetical protein
MVNDSASHVNGASIRRHDENTCEENILILCS